ncbi:MAG: N-methylhydantoinase B [Alphaproteobacteria bacterium]|jgi:N-methylhydantoinase B
MMIDAVTIEVLRNKVAGLVDEMHYHFYRSGYSTIIRESRDFSCVILDAEGRLITAPPMFFHGTVYRHFCARVLTLYGQDIAPGDVFVSNHPYDAGLPHVSDMGFIAPIFAGGKLIGFSGSIAHKADIGGTMPGSTSATATEIFHEGLLLPPIRFKSGGKMLPDIERLILANTRQPELVAGDIGAQVAATEMGVARMEELATRFGPANVTGAFAAILKGAADELASAIGNLPAGTASAEGFMDSDGIELDRMIRMAVTVTVKNGRVQFDFSDSDKQAKGPINLRPSMVEACCFYALIGCLGPDIAFNDGCRDLVDFVYAPDTITNATAPAPVSSYQMANLKLVDVILEALAHFRPERAVANAGSSGALGINWGQAARAGQANLQYEILGSAYGGGFGHDGASCTATHLSNLHVTPIEILESEFPCRVTAFELVPDSGGAGEFRGGLSFRRAYELLADGMVIRRYDRAKCPPQGIDGGKPGRASRFVIKAGTPDERETPASGRFDLKAGDHLYLESAGGGGYGDPAKRDPARLARDIEEGYVTAPAAKRDYGKN